MSIPREPLPAKLLIGVLFRDFVIQQQVIKILLGRFGPADFISVPEPFYYTAYYNREMGPDILRQKISFIEPLPVESLPEIKLYTNSLESKFSAEGNRQVNIDPGFLSEERFILATGKNFTHRIYLKDGIYADLTLIYQQEGFKPLSWTFPDHQDPKLLHYLNMLRQKLIYQRTGKLPRKSSKKREVSHDL
jgi:hypothetical protein